MANFYLPPAVSVNNFVGGYKVVSDYTDLEPTETNNSENVLYGPNKDLDQRAGSLRVLPLKLTSNGGSIGRPITGHFYFNKLGDTSSFHVVAAGDSIFNYTSSTQTTLTSVLTDSSENYFTFAQIQDPRSAADDLVLMTNGVNEMLAWNGSGSAFTFSAITSATQVPTAKFILTHKNRIYAANIVDPGDSDSKATVRITEFGTDGAPNPHRFTNFFVVGGSTRAGEINNARILNDQYIIYKRKSVWKFSPGNGNVLDTSSLIELEEAIGLFAPHSLVDVGDFHIFLSEQGVYAFDGTNFTHLSEKIDDDLFVNANRSRLKFAKGVYNKQQNQYILYYASGSSVRNNRAVIFDLRLRVWQPPVTGRRVNYISTFDDVDGIERIIYGDYSGYLYEDGRGDNDGLTNGFNGTVSSATFDTLTDTTATFTTTNDGLTGLVIRINSGPGEGQERVIASNTGTVITVDTSWDQIPDTTSTYTIGGINAFWKSKDYDYVGHDIVKIFRKIKLRVREQGDFPLDVTYIVDFKSLNDATTKGVSLRENSFVWGLSLWGSSKYGAKATIIKTISLRNTSTQSTNGTHLAIRFSNDRANETFRISGFDVETKAIGKR